MDNLGKTLDLLKIPNPFRDVIVTIGGFSLLLFIQIYLNIDLLSRLKDLNLGRVEIDLVIVVVAFPSGKILLLLSDIVLYIIFLLIDIPVKLFVKGESVKHQLIVLKNDWKFNWKKTLSNFLGYEPPKSVSYNEVRNEITALEMSAAIKDHPSLASDIERSVYHGIFLRLFLSMSLIGLIFSSIYYLVPFIILLLFILSNNSHLRDEQHTIYRGIVKNIYKDK